MKNKLFISLFSLVLLIVLIVVSTGLGYAELLGNPILTDVSSAVGFKNTMFADVTLTHPNYNAIYYLKNTEVINGNSTKDKGIFIYRPDDSVNRAEFLKIIYEGTGNANNEDYGSCFPDIPANAWYSTYVCQAKEDGVVAGYPDGTFKPEQTINQAEALKILSELTDEEKPSPKEDLQWYEYYSIPAAQKNIMPVEDVGKLLTRGEIAEMIYRNNQIDVLNVPYYDPQWDSQVFDVADIPLTGALGPGGLLGPGGPLGVNGAFGDDGPFSDDADGIELISEDFYNENYCYFSDEGDFSGDALYFLRDFGDADWDQYLEKDNLEDFGKMFCYPEEMEDAELVYFSEELRSEYEVFCWQDDSLPRLMNDDSQEILCYAAPPETSDQEYEESTLAVYVGGFEETAINYDDSMVKVLEFNLGAYTDESTEFYGIKVTNFGEGDGYGVRRFILKDDMDNVLYDSPIHIFDWQERSMELVFNEAAILVPGEYRWYSLYADFDWEDYNGELLFGFEDSSAILTLIDMAVHLGPNTDGPLLSVIEPLDPPEEDWPLCAFVSAVNGKPYTTEEEAEDPPTPEADAGGAVAAPANRPVVLRDGAHTVNPIQQQGLTCVAAAVYGSIRWLEERFGIDTLVANGQAGYDQIINLIYPPGPRGDQYSQAEDLKKYINENFPGCLVADYDSTWGTNPSCQSMKEYFDRDCDIPLTLMCYSIDSTVSNVIGHGVDMVDLQIDPNDPNKCTITFANSWPAGAGQLAGPDVDGLSGGVYEQAEFSNSDNTFKVKPAKWWSTHECYLSIAHYICVDDINACGAGVGDYIFPLPPEEE